ncbi:hypothetical protein GYB29_07985 [bacterium]|nr:hypothetical protein [bacterium]
MIKKLIKFNVIPLILALISPFFLPVDPAVAVICGFVLSLIFILSSAWVLDNFWNADSKLFIQVFFFSMAIRFLLVLAALGILLGITKIDNIYFTVSFIISYLYHSVMEMIFINQILLKKKQ